MQIDIIDDYSFLEPLVKEGQLDKKAKFLLDGVCYTDEKRQFFYVFHFYKTEIWATYGYASKYNKEFLKFHNIISNALLDTGVPVYRVGKNNDLKNHFKLNKIVDGKKIYQLIRKKG